MYVMCYMLHVECNMFCVPFYYLLYSLQGACEGPPELEGTAKSAKESGDEECG